MPIRPHGGFEQVTVVFTDGINSWLYKKLIIKCNASQSSAPRQHLLFHSCQFSSTAANLINQSLLHSLGWIGKLTFDKKGAYQIQRAFCSSDIVPSFLSSESSLKESFSCLIMFYVVLFCRINEDISQDDVYGIRLVPPCPNKRPYYFVVSTENERKVLMQLLIFLP